ncbi:hypothetical protein SSBG_00634 [Streptomyces sp. SPB074]|nr:hypothetical protein SSBG_00634 [Streptomyces sp. SPB074]
MTGASRTFLRAFTVQGDPVVRREDYFRVLRGRGAFRRSSGRPFFRFAPHSPGTPLDRVLIAVIVSALALPTGECQAATGSPAPATTDYLVATH